MKVASSKHRGLLLLRESHRPRYGTCPRRVPGIMLKIRRGSNPLMTCLANSRSSRWFVVLVLISAFSLAVSVATRYGFSYPEPAGAVVSIGGHASPQPLRQRLMQSVVTCSCPALGWDLHQVPASYHRVVPAAPSLPGLLDEEGLYNRPPPFLQLVA